MAIINNTWNIEHFQLKQNTAAGWTENADYILARGEIGLEYDTGKTKLGDGVKKWSELEYYSDPVLKSLVDALAERMHTAESNISSLENRVAAIEGITTISVNPALAGE